jgi:hypothetical protein
LPQNPAKWAPPSIRSPRAAAGGTPEGTDFEPVLGLPSLVVFGLG